MGKQSGESVELVLGRKKKGCGGKDSRKRKVLSLESQSERVMDDESGESIEDEVPVVGKDRYEVDEETPGVVRSHRTTSFVASRQSCPWVGLTHGSSWVEIF